jgi:hypothetical protein
MRVSQGDQRYLGSRLNRRHATLGAMNFKGTVVDRMRNAHAKITGIYSLKKPRVHQ